MSARPAIRAAAWSQLAAAIYLAFAPINGFVVCHEPDGAVSVELATAERRCAGCSEEKSGEKQEQEPREPCSAPACSRDHRDCPCVDVPLGPTGELARVASTQKGPVAPPVAIAPTPAFLSSLQLGVDRRASGVVAPARPPGLPHLRSVVLVV